jgi:hypothetical protein
MDIPSANTHLSTVMVAERAARLTTDQMEQLRLPGWVGRSGASAKLSPRVRMPE